MSADNRGKRSNRQTVTALKKLLGSLELEVMEFMWRSEEATVRQVTKVIDRKRPIAYTTVMTVMGHLVNKGLLSRTKEGKRYRYRLTKNRQEFLQETSKSRIRTLLDDFGDLAIAQFLGEIANVNAGRLEELRNLVQEASSENDVSG